MVTSLLDIRNLFVSINGKGILRDFNLVVRAGEVHAIMGPNGSGKSTLSKVIAGDPLYEVTRGQVLYKGENILGWTPEDRALKGIFMAFQYPVEVPGVNNASFLRMAYNARRKARGEDQVDPLDFNELLKKKLKTVEMSEDLLKRSLNQGFSGGEKKRNEIFQMAVLEPELAVLDETDSGLDIDALRQVASGVNKLRRADNAIVLITHYQRLLEYVVPDHVHVLSGGRIVRSGGKELALELEKKGYEHVAS